MSEVDLSIRYVFVTPGSHRDRWVRIISECCEASGVVLKSEAHLHSSEPGDIILLTDLRHLPSRDLIRAGNVVVIYLGSDGAFQHFTSRVSATERDALVDASRVLSTALEMPLIQVVDGTRDVRDASLIFSDLRILLPPLVPSPTRAPRSDLSDEAALAIFDNGVPIAEGSEVFWPPELMITDPRGEAARNAMGIDMTGSPRSLIFGSDLWLPPGRWEVVVSFDVDSEGVRHHLRMDWGMVDHAAEFEIHLERPGRYEATMVSRWDRAASSDLRIVLTEGCVSGRFSYLGARIRKLG